VRVKLGFWPWAVIAAISWFGFQEAGVHPALGLLPIIPAIPHADISFGFFAEKEKYLDDTLNHIEHSLKVPVEVILFFFGLANAGVQLSSVNEATYAVLAGLFIGKPLGIWLFGVVAANGLKLGLPQGMRSIDLFVIGCIAAIGFTVSLFVAVAAFGDATGDAKQWLEGAKMGALLSFFAAGMAIAAGWLCKVERMVER
jgi:NhaA family Na+:H+ antiporter